MSKYVCTVCGFIYDEEEGEPESDIERGTPWDEVPEDYICPVCGAGKDYFEEDIEIVDDDE